MLDKRKTLGQILVAQGALDPHDQALLEPLIARHGQIHGDDPERSLAALSSLGPARRDLEAIADPDLQASLPCVAAGRAPDDPDATQSYAAGQLTSAGTRFRILRSHAKGGLGEVFVARDEELKREVALKQARWPRRLVPDKGYSYPRIWRWPGRRRIGRVIPTRKDQPRAADFDKAEYRKRSIVERGVGWSKECRQLLARLEKLAVNYFASWIIASFVRLL